MLYSAAGTGKTIATTTLLKIPELKVRYLCLESNSMPAIAEGLDIHNITELTKGQLTIATPKGSGINNADTYMDQTDDSFYQAIIKSAIMNYAGVDVATGEDVKYGQMLTWGKDVCLVIDGLTMLQYACANRGRVVSLKRNNDKSNPLSEFYMGQDTLIGTIYQLMQSFKGHIVILAHETQSVEVARKKYRNLTEIHPALGTRSIVSPFLGRFTNVFYQRRNIQTNKFVWSVAQPGVYTVSRNIKIPTGRRGVNLDNLPPDFSDEIYSFF